MNKLLKSSFLLALVLFCATELVMRIFFSGSMDGRFEYGYSPTSGFVEGADGMVRLVSAGGRKFRPQKFTKVPSPDTFRIMVIGDSVSRGPSLEAAYPWLVKEQMCAQGIKTECFNLGLPGYGCNRKEVVLRKALDYSPDLVILHINKNNEFEDEREFKRSQDFKGWHPKNWIMKSFLVRRLYEAQTEKIFWKWLPAVIRNQKAVNDMGDKSAVSQNGEKQREWAERVKKYAAESASLAKARNVPLLFIVQSYECKAGPGKYRLDDKGVEGLVRPLEGPGVYVLSMKEAFEPFLPAGLYNADGTHLKPEGHKRIAEAIVRFIKHAERHAIMCSSVPLTNVRSTPIAHLNNCFSSSTGWSPGL